MSKTTFEERLPTFKPARLDKELVKIRTKKQEHSDQLSHLIKMEKLIVDRQTALVKEQAQPERKRMTFAQRKEMIEREIQQADENLALFNTQLQVAVHQVIKTNIEQAIEKQTKVKAKLQNKLDKLIAHRAQSKRSAKESSDESTLGKRARESDDETPAKRTRNPVDLTKLKDKQLSERRLKYKSVLAEYADKTPSSGVTQYWLTKYPQMIIDIEQEMIKRGLALE